MKKQIIFCLIAVLFPLGIFAQITSGNINDGGTKPVKNNQDQGAFHNTFFLAFGLTSSMGNFHENVLTLNDVVARGYGGMSKGLTFTMGSNFYFKNVDLTKIGLPDKFKLGLDVTYLNVNFTRGINTLMFDAIGSSENVSRFIGAKVGPVLSYNPIGKLIIDVKFTFQPTVLLYDKTLYSYSSLYSFDYYEYAYGTAFKIRKAFGIYARYKPFMLGLELSWGKANFKQMYVQYQDGFTYDGYSGYYPNYENSYLAKKLGTTRFDFVFGFSF